MRWHFFDRYDIVGGLTAASPLAPEVVQYADTIILETATCVVVVGVVVVVVVVLLLLHGH